MEQIQTRKKFKLQDSFFYKSSYLLIVIGLVFLNNLHHSTVVYHSISRESGSTTFDWGIAIVVNIILDLAVIAFVVYGQHKEAFVFAVLTFLINGLYYEGAGILRDPDIRKYLAQIIYSLTFPFAIWKFSKLTFGRSQEESLKDEQSIAISTLKEEKEKLEAELKIIQEQLLENEKKNRKLISELEEKFIKQINQLETTNKELSAKLQELTKYSCQYCAEPYKSPKSLNAHNCKSKENPKNKIHNNENEI